MYKILTNKHHTINSLSQMISWKKKLCERNDLNSKPFQNNVSAEKTIFI